MLSNLAEAARISLVDVAEVVGDQDDHVAQPGDVGVAAPGADGDQVGAVFGRHHGQVRIGDDGFGGGDEDGRAGVGQMEQLIQQRQGLGGRAGQVRLRTVGTGERGQHGVLAFLVQTEQFDAACFHAGHGELEAVGAVVEDDQVHERVLGRAQDELGEVGGERDAGRDHVGDVEVEDEGMGDAGCVLDLELVDPGGEGHWHVGLLSVNE